MNDQTQILVNAIRRDERARKACDEYIRELIGDKVYVKIERRPLIEQISTLVGLRYDEFEIIAALRKFVLGNTNPVTAEQFAGHNGNICPACAKSGGVTLISGRDLCYSKDNAMRINFVCICCGTYWHNEYKAHACVDCDGNILMKKPD